MVGFSNYAIKQSVTRNGNGAHYLENEKFNHVSIQPPGIEPITSSFLDLRLKALAMPRKGADAD